MTDYATLAELQGWLGISDSDDVPILEACIDTASRLVDAYCGRRFYVDTSATARTYYPVDGCLVRVDDISTSSGLIVKTDEDDDGTYETTWTSTDYQLEPLNGIEDGLEGFPTSRIRAVGTLGFPTVNDRPSVQVTAVWGWSAVPAAVKRATLMQAARLHRRKQTPEGIAGGDQFGAIRISSRIDPDVGHALAAYRKVGGHGLVVA